MGGTVLGRRAAGPGAWPVLLLMLLWVGRADAEMQPEAVGILDRMFKAYASAAAFACEGSCDDHEEGSALLPDHRTVTMRFVRPDRFRLAWTQKDFHNKSGTSVIFTRGKQIFFRQWGEAQDEAEPSLGQALDSCAGISLGLTFLVPPLLFGERGYLDFVSLRQLVDANSQDGRPCWKLAGETSEGTRWELLVDRETCALREALEINALTRNIAPPGSGAADAHPEAGNASPPHAIRTRYRFTNIRFVDSLPDNDFAEPTPAAKKKR